MKKNKIMMAAMAGLLTGFAGMSAAGLMSQHAYAEDAVEKHACAGQNSCAGKGTCKCDKNECAGKNACKGQCKCKTDGSK